MKDEKKKRKGKKYKMIEMGSREDSIYQIKVSLEMIIHHLIKLGVFEDDKNVQK